VKNGESDNQRDIFLMEEMKEGVGRSAELSGIRPCKSLFGLIQFINLKDISNDHFKAKHVQI